MFSVLITNYYLQIQSKYLTLNLFNVTVSESIFRLFLFFLRGKSLRHKTWGLSNYFKLLIHINCAPFENSPLDTEKYTCFTTANQLFQNVSIANNLHFKFEINDMNNQTQHKQKKINAVFLLWHAATATQTTKFNERWKGVISNIENYLNELITVLSGIKYEVATQNNGLIWHRYDMVEWFDVVSNKTIDQLVYLANSLCLSVLDIEFWIPMGPLSAIICNTEIYWHTQFLHFMDYRCEAQWALSFRLVEHKYIVHKKQRKLNNIATSLILRHINGLIVCRRMPFCVTTNWLAQ